MRPDPTGETVAVVTVLRLCQVFEFTDEDGREYKWDVTKAAELAAPRKSDAAGFVLADQGVTPETLRRMNPTIDAEYASALSKERLLEPLLFVPFKGKVLLVDGFHRLMAAALHGIPALLALVLTPDEEEAVRISGGDPAEVREKGGRP